MDLNDSNFESMFEAFRKEYGYTAYPENRSAAETDIPLAAVIYISGLVSLATLIATIGIRGKERWSMFIRVSYSLFVGAAILVSIFGHGWQHGALNTDSYYTFMSERKFSGTVGVKMGLNSVNVTLIGTFGKASSQVDYNERLRWFDVGEIQSEYEGCLQKGLPEPILSLAAYFSFDDGGLRWGRGYREAGYFTYVLLWTSFSFWLVTNVLLGSVVFYGSAMCLLSGVTIDIAVIVYHVLQPRKAIIVPFENGFLTLRYDWSFWLMVAAGCLTTVVGILLLSLDWIMPRKLSAFFLVDSLMDEDEDETNHNLARSPNENDVTPVKRSYLSLLEKDTTKSGLGRSKLVDRQTSTMNGEVRVNMYHSVEDLRPSNLTKIQYHSQGCLTADDSPMGSQAMLIKNDPPESENSSFNNSIESLPLEVRKADHVAVDIPNNAGSGVSGHTDEKDTHL